MTQHHDIERCDSRLAIHRRERWLIAAWVVGLLAIYIIGGALGARQLHTYKTRTESWRNARLNAVLADAQIPMALTQSANQRSLIHVSAGIRVRRISEFSLKDSEWTADFDIWFRWSGGTIHPGESFEILNGDIQRRDKIESFDRDGLKYERYRVIARMTTQFDCTRFPFGDESLLIEIQDPGLDAPSIRYVADSRDSGLEPDAFVQYVKLKRSLLFATTSRIGEDPAAAVGTEVVRSKLIFAMLVIPMAEGIYMMMFQALFASVAVAMLVFFIRVTYDNTRFTLPVGAIFAAVANNIFVSTLLPRADQITLANMIYTASLLTIFLVLVQSTIALHWAGPCGRERLARVFDRISVAVIAPCYLGVNLALPWVAMPSS